MLKWSNYTNHTTAIIYNSIKTTGLTVSCVAVCPQRARTIGLRNILSTRWLSCLVDRIKLSFQGPVARSGFSGTPIYGWTQSFVIPPLWKENARPRAYLTQRLTYFENSVIFVNLKKRLRRGKQGGKGSVLTTTPVRYKVIKKRSNITAAGSGLHSRAKSTEATARPQMRTRSRCPGLNWTFCFLLLQTTKNHNVFIILYEDDTCCVRGIYCSACGDPTKHNSISLATAVF